MKIQTYDKKVNLVQPVEEVKPARPAYNEKQEDSGKLRKPEGKNLKGSLVDCLV